MLSTNIVSDLSENDIVGASNTGRTRCCRSQEGSEKNYKPRRTHPCTPSTRS